MAITMWELVPSRRHRGSVRDPSAVSVDLHFMLKESTDDEAVRDYLIANKPATHLGLHYEDHDLVHLGAGIWEAVCHYGTAGDTPAEVNRRAFRIGATTQHIIRSHRTIERYSAAGIGAASLAPVFNGLIGVNQDNTIEGVDVYVRELTFTETKTFTDDEVTNSFELDLEEVALTVNMDEFQGRQPGEVLFMGVSGAPKDAGLWELTFEFKVRRNELIEITGITPNNPTDEQKIAKRGWEILWVFPELVKDTNNVTVPRPKFVYVEEYYPEGDFAKLQLDV